MISPQEISTICFILKKDFESQLHMVGHQVMLPTSHPPTWITPCGNLHLCPFGNIVLTCRPRDPPLLGLLSQSPSESSHKWWAIQQYSSRNCPLVACLNSIKTTPKTQFWDYTCLSVNTYGGLKIGTPYNVVRAWYNPKITR